MSTGTLTVLCGVAAVALGLFLLWLARQQAYKEIHPQGKSGEEYNKELSERMSHNFIIHLGTVAVIIDIILVAKGLYGD
jgi:hypothetical protein